MKDPLSTEKDLDFELSEAIGLLELADELIESAPLHHYGKEYTAWQEKRHDYFARRRAGEPELEEITCPRCKGSGHIGYSCENETGPDSV